MAIVISLLSTEIYRLVASRNLVIRMPDGVPPAVAKSFLALIPGFCVLAVVLALRLIVEASPFGDINSMITTLIGIPMSHVGGSLPGMIISVILIGILWTLGLHGDTIVLVFIRPVWLSNMSENLEAFQNGLPIPHIITQQFYDLWIAPGGTGALLGLVIFMLLRSRSQQMKQLGKIAAPGALFNISEPMVFGIPLVMNPYFFLPLILTPVLLVIVSYTAMATGLVMKPAGDCAAVYHADFYERLSGDGGTYFRRGAAGGEPGDLAGDLLSVFPGMGSPEGKRRAGVSAAGSQRDAVCGGAYLKRIPGGGA
ncbi:PTS system protein [Klebsiella grimontii]|uniref:PTS system protein n=1 Tax=Klebsiella grimontii TaxID=2058152 RepID=A0A7H4PBB8_9ENTR|nr:PTS system protein [Klebsiella grimontii]